MEPSTEDKREEASARRPHRRRLRLQSVIIIALITAVVTVPVFIILYRYLPIIEVPLGEGLRIGHILVFLLLYFLLYFVIRQLRHLFYYVAAAGLVALTVTSITGSYTFRNLYYDYAALLYNLRSGAVQIQFLEKNEEFTNEERMRNAIEYDSKSVRNFAVNSAVAHFEDYVSLGPNRTVIQSFSIFKEIRTRWRYVHDPHMEDYYASASETLDQLKADGKVKGDCDDYSILMAACLKAIGAEVRLIRTTIDNDDGTTTGHIYPECKIGDEKDLEQVTYLIKEKLFEKESKDKEIYYHVDKDGSVWLNFDYNDYYPGGAYQSTVINSIIKI